MSSKKTVIITPVLLPPDPADFDELCPFAREVMHFIDLQYAHLLNSYGHRPADLDVMRLSPIPCLEDCNQWNDIGITIDSGSRRNKKLVEQSEKNFEQILGKTGSDVGNVPAASDSPDAAKARKRKVDFQDFAFRSKKKKVLPKCGPAEKPVTEETSTDVRVGAPEAKRCPRATLAQFAFKPHTNPVEGEHEPCSVVNKIAGTNASSDDSCAMSFSQDSVGDKPPENLVISETPASRMPRSNVPVEESAKTVTCYQCPGAKQQLTDEAVAVLPQDRNELDGESKGQRNNGGEQYTGLSALGLLSQLYAASDSSGSGAANQNGLIVAGSKWEPSDKQVCEESGALVDTVPEKMDQSTNSMPQGEYMSGLGLRCTNTEVQAEMHHAQSPNGHGFSAKGTEDTCSPGRDNCSFAISEQDSIKGGACSSDSAEHIVHRSVSENGCRLMHAHESIRHSEEVCGSQSLISNKVDYMENWLSQLPNPDAELLESDDEPREMGKASGVSEPVNNVHTTELAETVERSRFATAGVQPAVNPPETGASEGECVEDWFKDMPDEYERIKRLLDFDTRPKPAPQAGRIKAVPRKTYVLEINRAPQPTPRWVQTKLTSMLRPVPQPSGVQKRQAAEEDAARRAKPEEAGETAGERCTGPRFVKRKHKFFTPVLSPVAEKAVSYEVYSVDEALAGQMEAYLKHNVPHEICWNVLYSDGCCQLSQPKKPGTGTPAGLMLIVSWLTQKQTHACFTEFYHLNVSPAVWQEFSVLRSLVNTCLTLDCRKVCFKAQRLFLFLRDALALAAGPPSPVLDPFVGCWVLDPDHPPSTFQGVQSQLGTRPKYTVAAGDALLRACDLLIQLSETMHVLQRRLADRDLWPVFVDMEMRIVPILAGMEHHGISANAAMLAAFSSTLRDQLEAVERRAHCAAGRKFQLSSPLQVRRILYDELQLDRAHAIEIAGTAAAGVKSTAEPMLQLLRPLHPLPGLILEHRHLQKAKSTFVDSMRQHVRNGTIRCSWEHTAAATGRIASSHPNLQAIPKHPFPVLRFPELADASGQATLRLRNAYNAQPGYSLLAADFQHIELRVFAHLSRDETIREALKAPGDIFTNMAQSWLGTKEQRGSTEHREHTKKIVYATIYGAGPGRLADILSVSVDEAARILRDFAHKFPSLREFSAHTVEQCRIQGYLTSLSGRRRLFPNINSSTFGLKAQSERQAVNFLIQGSAADICKAAMIRTEDKLQGFDCKLLLQIHDELVWEVMDTQLEPVTAIVRAAMEDTSTMCGRLMQLSVPLPVAISVGKRWGDMH